MSNEFNDWSTHLILVEKSLREVEDALQNKRYSEVSAHANTAMNGLIDVKLWAWLENAKQAEQKRA